MEESEKCAQEWFDKHTAELDRLIQDAEKKPRASDVRSATILIYYARTVSAYAQIDGWFERIGQLIDRALDAVKLIVNEIECDETAMLIINTVSLYQKAFSDAGATQWQVDRKTKMLNADYEIYACPELIMRRRAPDRPDFAMPTWM